MCFEKLNKLEMLREANGLLTRENAALRRQVEQLKSLVETCTGGITWHTVEIQRRLAAILAGEQREGDG